MIDEPSCKDRVVDLTAQRHLGEFEVDREATLGKADVERMRRALDAAEVL